RPMRIYRSRIDARLLPTSPACRSRTGSWRMSDECITRSSRVSLMRGMSKAAYIKSRSMDAVVATIAVLAGAVIVYAGDRLLGVKLELFYGVSTFTPAWVLALFFVPFVAGIVVSLIYGLGGKILAHFSPLIVRVVS